MTDYYESVLGFRQESPAVLDGEWQDGPRVVFDMSPGTSHWYVGFVSPNNICGKLKFFVARDRANARDRSSEQKPGYEGITLHTLWTPKLDLVAELAQRAGIETTAPSNNEFGERSVALRGPDGATWQIIQRSGSVHTPLTELEFTPTNN